MFNPIPPNKMIPLEKKTWGGNLKIYSVQILLYVSVKKQVPSSQDQTPYLFDECLLIKLESLPQDNLIDSRAIKLLGSEWICIKRNGSSEHLISSVFPVENCITTPFCFSSLNNLRYAADASVYNFNVRAISTLILSSCFAMASEPSSVKGNKGLWRNLVRPFSLVVISLTLQVWNTVWNVVNKTEIIMATNRTLSARRQNFETIILTVSSYSKESELHLESKI